MGYGLNGVDGLGSLTALRMTGGRNGKCNCRSFDCAALRSGLKASEGIDALSSSGSFARLRMTMEVSKFGDMNV